MLPWGSALVAGLVHDLVFWSDWTLKGLLFIYVIRSLLLWFTGVLVHVPVMCSLLFIVACLCSLMLESHHIESILYAGLELFCNQRCHESLSET